MASLLAWVLNEVESGKWNLTGSDTSGPEWVIVIDETYSTPQEALDKHGLSLSDVDLIWRVGDRWSIDGNQIGHDSIAKNPTIPPSFAESLHPQPSDVSFPVISSAQADRILRGDFTGIKFTVSLDAAIGYTYSAYGAANEGGGRSLCTGEEATITASGAQTFTLESTRLGARGCYSRDCTKPEKLVDDSNLGGGLLNPRPSSVLPSSDPIPVHVDFDYVYKPCPGSAEHTPGTLDSTITSAIFGMSAQFGFLRSATDNKVHIHFAATFQYGPIFLAVYAPVSGAHSAKEVYGFPDPPTEGGTVIPITGISCEPANISAPPLSGSVKLFGVHLEIYGWIYAVDHSVDHSVSDPLSCCDFNGCKGSGIEQYTPSVVELIEL